MLYEARTLPIRPSLHLQRYILSFDGMILMSYLVIVHLQVVVSKESLNYNHCATVSILKHLSLEYPSLYIMVYPIL